MAFSSEFFSISSMACMAFFFLSSAFWETIWFLVAPTIFNVALAELLTAHEPAQLIVAVFVGCGKGHSMKMYKMGSEEGGVV